MVYPSHLYLTGEMWLKIEFDLRTNLYTKGVSRNTGNTPNKSSSIFTRIHLGLVGFTLRTSWLGTYKNGGRRHRRILLVKVLIRVYDIPIFWRGDHQIHSDNEIFHSCIGYLVSDGSMSGSRETRNSGDGRILNGPTIV